MTLAQAVLMASAQRVSWVIIAGILCGRSVMATPLTVDGGWAALEWNCGAGQIVDTAGCQATPSDGFYEFTLTQSGALTLTDLFTAGDEFDVTISQQGGGTSTLSSSPVSAGDEGFQPCPDFAVEPCYSTFGAGALASNTEAVVNYYLTSGHYSTLRWFLTPGVYDVSFAVTALAPDIQDTFPGDFQEAGLAAVRVDTVPEPASLLLLGSGIAGFAARQRSKGWGPRVRARV